MNFEVHVLGGHKGESIVLKFPSGVWGVVDCFCDDHSDSQTNEALKFLKSEGVQKLEFVCMTHPHKDHYLGIRQLLSEFEVAEFWYPSAISVENMVSLVKWREQERTQAGLFTGNRQIDELGNLWHAYFQLFDNKKIKPVHLQLNTKIANSLTRFGVEIIGLGPSSAQSQRYHSLFADLFNADGTIRKRLKHSDPNLISIALSIKSGQSTVILGGDVDSKGWSDALEDATDAMSSTTLVKVAHHGSSDSYCSRTWNTMKGKSTVAVITPYKRFGLPEENVVVSIKSHASEVYTVSKDAVSWRPTTPTMGLIACSLKTRKNPQPLGHFRFLLESDGKVEIMLKGDCGNL